MNTIGERIKIVRTKNNLKQKDFADRVFVSASYISMLESGKETPTDMLLKLISLDFNVSFSWLKDGNGEMVVKHEYDYFERNNIIEMQEGINEELQQFRATLQKVNIPSINMNTISIFQNLNNLVNRHTTNLNFATLIYEQITNIILSSCDALEELDQKKLNPNTVSELYRILRTASEDNYNSLMEIGTLYEQILFKN